MFLGAVAKPKLCLPGCLDRCHFAQDDQSNTEQRGFSHLFPLSKGHMERIPLPAGSFVLRCVSSVYVRKILGTSTCKAFTFSRGRFSGSFRF